MHRRGDVPLEIGFITAAVELVAKINQDKPVVTKLPFQPGRIDERCCRRRGRHRGNDEQQRGQRHGHDATNKFLH